MFILLTCISLLTAEPVDFDLDFAAGFGNDPRLLDLDPFGLDGAFDTGDKEVAVGGAFDLRDDYNDLDFMHDFDNALHGDREEQTNQVQSYMGQLDLPIADSSFGMLQTREERIGGGDEAAPAQEQTPISLGKTKSCVANGLWCKCGFQSLFWAYERINDGHKDCYTLEGTCQTCGIAERVTSVGFDYKYNKKKKKDVYDFRYKMQMENWWDPPKYRYHCLKGYAITGVKTSYQRLEELGQRDVYSLAIKCGQIKTKIPPERVPVPGLTWYACDTKEDWSSEKKEWCALSGYPAPGEPATEETTAAPAEPTQPEVKAETTQEGDATAPPTDTTKPPEAKEETTPPADTTPPAGTKEVTKVKLEQSYAGVTDCDAYKGTIKTVNSLALGVDAKDITVTPGAGCDSLESDLDAWRRRRLLRRALADVTFGVEIVIEDKEKADTVSKMSGDDIKKKVSDTISNDPNLGTLEMTSSSEPATTKELVPDTAAEEDKDATEAPEENKDATEAPATDATEENKDATEAPATDATEENKDATEAPATDATEENKDATEAPKTDATEENKDATEAPKTDATEENKDEATTSPESGECAEDCASEAENQDWKFVCDKESRCKGCTKCGEIKDATEAPKTDATEENKDATEAPKTDATEENKDATEAPKTDATEENKDATEAPKTDATEENKDATEAPKTDATEENKDATEAPKTDATEENKDATEAPKTDATEENKDATEAPKTDATEENKDATEAPKTDATEENKDATEAPKTDATEENKDATEAPKTDATEENKDATEAPATDATEENKDATEAPATDATEENKDATEAPATDATEENKDATEAPGENNDATEEASEDNGDALEVMTAEGEDTGKTCKEAWKELKEAVPTLTGCPPSLKEQCPATCSEPALGLEAEMELAEEQPAEPSSNGTSLSTEVTLLILGASVALAMGLGLYTWFRGKGDALHVEYLLAEQDEYANYVDEF